MKKRVICGSAAVLLTGLTGAMFTTAAPHARDVCVAPSVLPDVAMVVIDGVRYTVTTSPLGTSAHEFRVSSADHHD